MPNSNQKDKYAAQLKKEFLLSEIEKQCIIKELIPVDENIGTLFECNICFKIVIKEKECQKCKKLFCNECIQAWLNNINKCPCCSITPMNLDQMNFNLKYLLDTMLFECQCKTKFSNQDLMQVHIQSCFEKPIKCINGCGSTVQSTKDAMKHYEICKESQVNCSKCNEIYKRRNQPEHQSQCSGEELSCKECQIKYLRKDQNQHNEVCQELEIQCTLCNQEMLRKYLFLHNDRCPNVQIECQECEENYLRKDTDRHDCVNCLKQLVKQLRIQTLQDQNKIQSLLSQQENQFQNNNSHQVQIEKSKKEKNGQYN